MGSQTFRPGSEVVGVTETGVVRSVWAGFARSEILGWWRARGGVLLEIHAERFAERSGETGKLVWEEMPEHLVLRGLLDVRTSRPLLKMVTRESTPAEWRRFAHLRMPLSVKSMFAKPEDGILRSGDPPGAQVELF